MRSRAADAEAKEVSIVGYPYVAHIRADAADGDNRDAAERYSP